MMMSNRDIDRTKAGVQHSGVPPDPQTDVMPTADTTSLTPGQVLKARREQCAMSVQQAADKLHLTRHYVQSLESDCHAKLPGEVFVKGYIRAYAKLLEIDPEHLVRLYHQHAGKREASAPAPVMQSAVRRRDRNRPWIVVSGIAFVLFAALLWLTNGQPFSSPVQPPAPSVSSPPGSASESSGSQQRAGGGG